MIEQFATQLVKELGATGLLVLGLIFSLLYTGKGICKPLKVINQEIGEIRDLLKEILIRKEK